MKCRDVAPQSNRFPNVIDRHLMSTCLVGHHAHQVDRVDMLWFDRQNLLIDVFGGLLSAGLMVLEGDLQCFADRRHGMHKLIRMVSVPASVLI